MLGVKYNNTTTCKIDGWLRSTIDQPASAEKSTIAGKCEKKYLMNDGNKQDNIKMTGRK